MKQKFSSALLEHSPGGAIRLRGEVYEWLITNVGWGTDRPDQETYSFWRWSWSFEKREGDRAGQYLMVISPWIEFHDLDQALLFKLTWGGHV